MVMPSRCATFCHTLYHIVTYPVCKQKLRLKLRYIDFSAGSTVVCEMVRFGPFQIQITWEMYSIETDSVRERVKNKTRTGEMFTPHGKFKNEGRVQKSSRSI
jgi:hypothetical protein